MNQNTEVNMKMKKKSITILRPRVMLQNYVRSRKPVAAKNAVVQAFTNVSKLKVIICNWPRPGILSRKSGCKASPTSGARVFVQKHTGTFGHPGENFAHRHVFPAFELVISAVPAWRSGLRLRIGCRMLGPWPHGGPRKELPPSGSTRYRLLNLLEAFGIAPAEEEGVITDVLIVTHHEFQRKAPYAFQGFFEGVAHRVNRVTGSEDRG